MTGSHQEYMSEANSATRSWKHSYQWKCDIFSISCQLMFFSSDRSSLRYSRPLSTYRNAIFCCWNFQKHNIHQIHQIHQIDQKHQICQIQQDRKKNRFIKIRFLNFPQLFSNFLNKTQLLMLRSHSFLRSSCCISSVHTGEWWKPLWLWWWRRRIANDLSLPNVH